MEYWRVRNGLAGEFGVVISQQDAPNYPILDHYRYSVPLLSDKSMNLEVDRPGGLLSVGEHRGCGLERDRNRRDQGVVGRRRRGATLAPTRQRHDTAVISRRRIRPGGRHDCPNDRDNAPDQAAVEDDPSIESVEGRPKSRSAHDYGPSDDENFGSGVVGWSTGEAANTRTRRVSACSREQLESQPRSPGRLPFGRPDESSSD
jgi:hypothetical protein